MSHYKPYTAYKDSGVEWLGRVPEKWAVMSIKHIVSTPITDGPHETPDFVDEGIPFVSAEAVSSGSIDFSKIRGFISESDHHRYSQKYHPRRDDIFMIKSGATTGVTSIVETDIDFNIWSPLAVIRCGQRSTPRFVLNFMRSRSFQEAIALYWSFGTQQNIGMGVIADLAITVPSLEEQVAIATHLDRETTRIDDLVSKKTRFIELLREKRQALITHAVTKGLDPNVKMKDSGVEWLGEVPFDWIVTPLKYIGSAIIGLTYSPENVVDEGDGTLVLRSSNIQDGRITLDDNVFVNAEIPDRLITRLGDILICSRNGSRSLIGKNGIVDSTSEGLSFGAFTTVFRTKHHKFLYYVLNSSLFKFQAGRFLTTTINQLTTETLNSFEIPLPPCSEQDVITSYLDYQTTRLDNLITQTERSIELLKERRSALITAAVTGQIDLREAA